MTDKEAADVLIGLLKKDALTDREREAVRAAVGVLGWTSLAEGRIKRLGEKKRRKAGLEG